MVETIEWTDKGVVMIDQTVLPRTQSFVTCTTYEQVADAIKTMVIRGAPAIGVAAAMGVALGVRQGADFDTVCSTLAATRPTAVNLFWGIERMKRLYATLEGQPLAKRIERMIAEAKLVREEDIAICKSIGAHGGPLVPDGKTVLTLRQLHPTPERRKTVIDFGAVEYGYQTLDKLAKHLGVA